MQTADISKDKSTVCSQNVLDISTAFTHYVVCLAISPIGVLYRGRSIVVFS